MERFKGTKGRWFISGNAVVSAFKFLFIPVCRLYGHPTRKSRANAQLISEAPEMLRQLINVVEHSNYILYGDNEHCDVLHQMLASIKTTIKKATDI